ncbi:MAG: hypothetical protein M4579_005206 [Chaenotheca gracillima]|nr:MAG: hypothetical protein M4579_005206 [Chaenotheca gracillima]
MPFPYKKVLVLGATSGIGLALAERIIKEGSSVIAVGRRQANLDALVQKHGSDKVSAVQFDITHLDKIPSFVESVTKEHPDLDFVMLNSGMQRGFDFSKPETIDLSVLEEEFKTNYLSYIHLTTAFLPFLQAKKSKTAIAYVSSGLALVPLVRCPNYCSSKAALHHFVMSLRYQLRNGPVKVIEIFPPAVQTELHDAKHQPDIKNGGQIGMPLAQFTEEAFAGLLRDEDDIPVGTSVQAYKNVDVPRQKAFEAMTSAMAASGN